MAFTDLLFHIHRKKNTGLNYVSIILRKGKRDNMALRPAATQIDSPFAVLLKFRVEMPGGKHYLLCAFLNHYDLSEYLESIELLELAEARFYAAQILCALDCLHDPGIVCGRLQPSNIYIDFTGYLFLGDFDLYVRNIPGTRLPWPQPLSHDTKIHRPNEIDKPDQLLVDGYLVRELLATQGGGHDVVPTADWYSFGAILHQLLTGRLPCNLDAANNANTPLSIPIPPAPNGIPLPQPAEDLLAKLLSPRTRPSASAQMDPKKSNHIHFSTRLTGLACSRKNTFLDFDRLL